VALPGVPQRPIRDTEFLAGLVDPNLGRLLPGLLGGGAVLVEPGPLVVGVWNGSLVTTARSPPDARSDVNRIPSAVESERGQGRDGGGGTCRTSGLHACHRRAQRFTGGSTTSSLTGTVNLGSLVPTAKGGAMAQPRKLYRSRTDRKLAGVCGGLAQYFNTDATLIRVLFVVLAVLGGSGLVIYLAMWIIVPNEP
jgi:phage shock protein C